MKITFPKATDNFKLYRHAKLYAVVVEFGDKIFDFPDWTGLPYTSHSYHEAIMMKYKIRAYLLKYKVWKKRRFRVIKISG